MVYVNGPNSAPMCDLCRFTCYTHKAEDGTIVATHPRTAVCSDSGKAFEMPKFECKPLPDEYAHPNV